MTDGSHRRCVMWWRLLKNTKMPKQKKRRYMYFSFFFIIRIRSTRFVFPRECVFVFWMSFICFLLLFYYMALFFTQKMGGRRGKKILKKKKQNNNNNNNKSFLLLLLLLSVSAFFFFHSVRLSLPFLLLPYMYIPLSHEESTFNLRQSRKLHKSRSQQPAATQGGKNIVVV